MKECFGLIRGQVEGHLFVLVFLHPTAAFNNRNTFFMARAACACELTMCIWAFGAANGAAASAQINLSYMTLADPLLRAEYAGTLPSFTLAWSARLAL